jgi:hypothetical protein
VKLLDVLSYLKPSTPMVLSALIPSALGGYTMAGFSATTAFQRTAEFGDASACEQKYRTMMEWFPLFCSNDLVLLTCGKLLVNRSYSTAAMLAESVLLNSEVADARWMAAEARGMLGDYAKCQEHVNHLLDDPRFGVRASQLLGLSLLVQNKHDLEGCGTLIERTLLKGLPGDKDTFGDQLARRHAHEPNYNLACLFSKRGMAQKAIHRLVEAFVCAREAGQLSEVRAWLATDLSGNGDFVSMAAEASWWFNLLEDSSVRQTEVVRRQLKDGRSLAEIKKDIQDSRIGFVGSAAEYRVCLAEALRAPISDEPSSRLIDRMHGQSKVQQADVAGANSSRIIG